MSPELHQFLADWHEWATSGAPCAGYRGTKEGFSRSFGLCFHAKKRGTCLYYELEDLLVADFGDRADTPFDDGQLDYFFEGERGTMHLNPNRLAWVRKKLSEEL